MHSGNSPLSTMYKPSPLLSKTQLLRSKDVLDNKIVAEKLGITERSASNLLQRWANEGTVSRTAPGCYMSVLAESDKDKIILASLKKCLGPNIILVGASALKRVGWCDTDILHVAVPLRPSRSVPRVRNMVIYPVGAKAWLQLAKQSLQMDLHNPPLLHPLSQMLWWMDQNCPIEMPAPDRLNWRAITAETDVQAAMHKHWPEHLPPDFDVKTFYELLHMDRLTGRISGRAEPLDGQGAGERDEHMTPGSGM